MIKSRLTEEKHLFTFAQSTSEWMNSWKRLWIYNQLFVEIESFKKVFFSHFGFEQNDFFFHFSMYSSIVVSYTSKAKPFSGRGNNELVEWIHILAYVCTQCYQRLYCMYAQHIFFLGWMILKKCFMFFGRYGTERNRWMGKGIK